MFNNAAIDDTVSFEDGKTVIAPPHQTPFIRCENELSPRFGLKRLDIGVFITAGFKTSDTGVTT